MDPLSPWTYGRRNVRKILPTVIILTFVVMLVVVILSTLAGLRDSTLVYTREFDEWTLVFPKRDTRLPRALIQKIAAHPATERVIDSRNCFVRVKTLIGPMPFNLRAARPEEIDLVMCTHLHHDHVGWNTQLRDGKWIPTFPNARYVFSKPDVDYFSAIDSDPKEGPAELGTFRECVVPILEHGKADLVSGGAYRLNEFIEIDSAPGHSSQVHPRR